MSTTSRSLVRADSLFRTIRSSKKTKSSHYLSNGSYPVIDQGREHIAGYSDDQEAVIPGPAILFGDHTRVLKFIKFPFVPGADGTQLLTAREGVDIRFLFYALHTIPLDSRGYERHFKYLKEGEVMVPDPRSQQRIADILSAYDDLIENNTRRIAILENMARRLFEEWFGCFCIPTVGDTSSELPGGWMSATLHDWVDELRDAVDPTSVPSSTPYVGLEHLPRRSTTLTQFGRADEVGSTKLKFAQGDILFGKIRPYFHKVALAPFDGVSSSDAIVMRPKSSQQLPLALAVTSSDGFIAYATQTSNGTKMPRADWKVLRNYPLPIPPSDMLDRFNGLAEPWLWLSAKLAASNANLRTTRDLLLPKLISGEIEVPAAEEALEAAAA